MRFSLFLILFQIYTKRFECNLDSPEIGVIFFAYETLYNHIDDIKVALTGNTGLGALPLANYMLQAITKMEATLRKYYSLTKFPTVYGDAMILNSRTKLSIFELETWSDQLSETYSSNTRYKNILMLI